MKTEIVMLVLKALEEKGMLANGLTSSTILDEVADAADKDNRMVILSWSADEVMQKAKSFGIILTKEEAIFIVGDRQTNLNDHKSLEYDFIKYNVELFIKDERENFPFRTEVVEWLIQNAKKQAGEAFNSGDYVVKDNETTCVIEGNRYVSVYANDDMDDDMDDMQFELWLTLDELYAISKGGVK